MSYERFIQWAAGPASIAAGFGATVLANHGWISLSQKATTAHDIATAIIFAAGTGFTYAAHHKWLTNLPKYWQEFGGATILHELEDDTSLENKPDSGVVPDAPNNVTPIGAA